jgi:CheY-like chemotaxis protein
MRLGVRLAKLRRMSFRVLIVDDNASFLDAARVLLEREGLRVVAVASTSAEALQREQEQRPDVVLVDIMLANESGFELVRRLDAEGRGSGSAAILVSTHAEEDFADLIAASPAAGFLPKSELSAAAIRRTLDGRS